MRSFLGNAIMEKENKKKGQVMNIINKLSVVISVYNEEAVLDKMYQAVVPVVESYILSLHDALPILELMGIAEHPF